MKRNKIIVALVAGTTSAALLLGGAAFAKGQGFGGRGMDRPSFSELDTDGDGNLSVAELQARATARFEEMDANGDGVISAEESVAGASAKAGERAGMMFTRLLEWRDSDGDGALSQAEMGDNTAEKMFMRADADGNGMISAEEFEQVQKRGPKGGGFGGKGRNGDHSNRQGG